MTSPPVHEEEHETSRGIHEYLGVYRTCVQNIENPLSEKIKMGWLLGKCFPFLFLLFISTAMFCWHCCLWRILSKRRDFSSHWDCRRRERFKIKLGLCSFLPSHLQVSIPLEAVLLQYAFSRRRLNEKLLSSWKMSAPLLRMSNGAENADHGPPSWRVLRLRRRNGHMTRNKSGIAPNKNYFSLLGFPGETHWFRNDNK